ncbi:hypothetical protein CNMCM8927_007212 [Aspergillus lentulus]|uniref:mRNA stability protein n=1 Tax=Aspergillus lentulus TaxID=293939 RepID=A0AAN5YSB8_ASPLE|nr:hypothetical protein CNMCM8060_004181 [Aspergillus lentulus]KAF4188398.1 hypothetical protein CNMCM7927_001604 [Aspergillus lentulus]KAF4196448.1 hypothetical protein CNMCM8694_004808 [Aspergillus lentulus]KAF4204584.1 hypothetical protein CNMCM8927_007212 [Aspergillus lentulus]GFF73913.1 hypothetical protein IFM47457_03511 [Aspergillus lentulus]
MHVIPQLKWVRSDILGFNISNIGEVSEMDSEQKKQSTPESPPKDEEGLLRAYGRLPQRGRLFDQQAKGRKYFDSGDFALSTADRVTDIGAINTGRAHPQRDSVSHPYAPVPSSSNANEDANKDVRDKTFAGLKMTESPLHQQSDVGDTKQNLEKPKSD